MVRVVERLVDDKVSEAVNVEELLAVSELVAVLEREDVPVADCEGEALLVTVGVRDTDDDELALLVAEGRVTVLDLLPVIDVEPVAEREADRDSDCDAESERLEVPDLLRISEIELV